MMTFSNSWISRLLGFLILAKSGFSAELPASSFMGINWADARDNFVDGWIIPSGIDHRLSEAEVVEQASAYLRQFQTILGINTVRLGINPQTVLDQAWWPKYRALVREANRQKIKVILACWESPSSKDGKIDDHAAFRQMWDLVIVDFRAERGVFFEIFNEPHGYSDEEWRDLAHAWVRHYAPKIGQGDKSRILVSGSGYNENLVHVAADQRLQGCRLSFHLYSWFGGQHTNVASWKKEFEERIGTENAARTIVTEWGAPMKSRAADHYAQPPTTAEQAFLQGMSETIRAGNMGSIYWPGLRDGDDFSLLERAGHGAELKLTNESGKTKWRESFAPH
jgi:hypothetical protein